MAHEFLEYGIIDDEHEFFMTLETVGTLVESYLLKEPRVIQPIHGGTPKEYPKGTWFVQVKITDQDMIQKILTGERTGGSATTIEREDAERLKLVMKSKAKGIQLISTKSQIKRIFIAEIKDPVTVTISLVKSPCVPSAKFCSLKNRKDDIMTENIEEKLEKETQGFLDRIRPLFSSTKASPKDDEEEEETEKKVPEKGVSRKDFDEFKGEVMDLVTAMNSKVDKILEGSTKEEPKEDDEEEEVEGLTPEEEKTLNELLAKKASTKSENNEEDKEDEDEEEEEEIKASSKSIPNHEDKKKESKLSDTATVYKIMGRDNTGSRIKE